MPVVRKNLKYFLFASFLLLVVISIRSGLMVDASYLPRLLLLSLLLFFTTMLLFSKKIAFRYSWIDGVFILFFLWNLLSAIWSVLPSESMAQTALVFVSMAIFFITSILYERNQHYEKIFIGLTLAALLFSFILAFYRISVLTFYDPYQVKSISANNNLYAGILLISLPLCIAAYRYFCGLLRYISVFIGTLGVFMIVILQSRAVYFGLIMAAILLVLVVVLFYRSALNRRNLMVAAASLVLLISLTTIFYQSLDQTRRSYFMSKVPFWQYFRSYDQGVDKLLQQRQSEKAGLDGIPSFDYAGSYYENANLRIIFWKKSLCLFTQSPILGVGAGNWRINIASCPKPDNPDHTFKNYTYSQPHNEWIGFLTELGIPGLIMAVSLFIVPALIVFYFLVFKLTKPELTTAVYACFILGFALFASFDFPFKRVEHAVIFFSLLAFLRNKLPLKNLSVSGYFPGWKYSRYLLVIGLIFSIFITTMRIRGEFFTRLVFRAEGREPQKVVVACRQAENVFYRITPNALPLDWFAGVAYYNLNDPAAALESFSEALTLTPYEVRVLNDHATALYALGFIREAKADLQKALAIDPFFDDARINLAAIYFSEGNNDKARKLAEGCRNSAKKSAFLKQL